MGPLFVVLLHPLRSNLAHLIQRLERVEVKHLVAEGPIDPFHAGRLFRLVRLTIPQWDPAVRTPTRKSIGEKFRAWSSRIACGYWLQDSNHPFSG